MRYKDARPKIKEKVNMIKELESFIDNNDSWDFRVCNKNSENEFSQADVISSILNGNDTVALMPTGKGKTLCFQGPAILSNGVSIVITPLRSLYSDQVDSFNEKYCDSIATDQQRYAAYLKTKVAKLLGGALPRAAYPGMEADGIKLSDSKLFELLKSGAEVSNGIHAEYKLLYISPERLEYGKFFTKLISEIRKKDLVINAIYVDEVHVLSHWGFDFRPSYLNIRSFIQTYKKVTGKRIQIAGFTATASAMDIDRAKTVLDMDTPEEYICRESNENIKISIREIGGGKTKSKSLDTSVMDCLLNTEFNKCIIFCNDKRKVKNLYESIKNRIKKDKDNYIWNKEWDSDNVVLYHADIPAYKKKENEKRFKMEAGSEGELKPANVMIATVAFGLGVDNKAVDLVINYGMPRSMAEYYQEIGRVGRGGTEGNAVLFYKKDTPTVPGTVANMARWAAQWKLDLDSKSALNNLSDSEKDMLSMLRFYHFCMFKKAIDEALKSKDCNVTMHEKIKESFEENLLVANKDSMINAIEGLSKDVNDIFEEILKKNQDKLAPINQKAYKTVRDRKAKDRIEKSIKKYKGYINTINSSCKKSKDVIATYLPDVYEDRKKKYSEYSESVDRIVSNEPLFKINNTSIARILRTDRNVVLGEKVFFVEQESKTKKVRKNNNDENIAGLFDVEIRNKHIFDNTAFILWPFDKAERDIDNYIMDVYQEWMNGGLHESISIKYIYVLRWEEQYHDEPKPVKRREINGEVEHVIDGGPKYNACKVVRIYEQSENDWQLLGKANGIEDRRNAINEKNIEHQMENTEYSEDRLRVVHHLLCDANNIRVNTNETIATTFYDTEKSDRIPTIYIIGRRKKECWFELTVQDEETEKYDNKRIITYFDMVVLDAIYSLYYVGKTKIFLKSIWQIMTGPSEKISERQLSEGKTKDNLIKSIEKLMNINITIHDESLDGGEISGKFLDMIKDERGYTLNHVPPLFDYAEKINGRIISVSTNGFKMSDYMSVKYDKVDEEKIETGSGTGVHLIWGKAEKKRKNKQWLEPKNNGECREHTASKENVLLLHYLLHRCAIFRKTKKLQYIDCEKILTLFEDGEIFAKHNNVTYVQELAYKVIRSELKGYIESGNLSVKYYSPM